MKLKPISIDITIITILALCMAIGSYLLSGWLNEQTQNTLVWLNDRWFDADINRTYYVMTDRLSVEHDRSSTHPLFSIIAYPTMQVMTSILGIGPPQNSKTTCCNIRSPLDSLHLYYYETNRLQKV